VFGDVLVQKDGRGSKYHFSRDLDDARIERARYAPELKTGDLSIRPAKAIVRSSVDRTARLRPKVRRRRQTQEAIRKPAL
jgi:hypothetical protein